MFKSIILLLFSFFAATMAYASTSKVTGFVVDSAGIALAGVSVSMLDPADSTLVVFSISNSNGLFSLSEVPEGNYILQVAAMGYYSVYRKLQLPLEGNLGSITLQLNSTANLLNEVVISGEKIPVKLKGDTLEYDAASYKVKPDAMVEDLLRKLPGVQVDKDGNIKSMGKVVTKILVDGKEFFGNDPKIASKNLPADAIDQIQAFEKKSDETLFSGVDDGQREQILNLQLKEGKRAGYFGEAKGGLGAVEKYETSLRAFKFRTKTQLAGLGMWNNINKFGFSLQDYIDFNGGVGALLRNGGNINISDKDMPIDVGQPIAGKIASAVAGLNYNIEPWIHAKWNMSYMGNGIRKILDQYSSSRNYTPGADFEKIAESKSTRSTGNHQVLSSWKSEIESRHLITASVYAKLGNSHSDEHLYSRSYSTSIPQNELNSLNVTTNRALAFGGTAGWTTKWKGRWQLLQTKVDGAYSRGREDEGWNNRVSYQDTVLPVDHQYRNSDLVEISITPSMATIYSLGKGFLLGPSVKGLVNRQSLQRIQGNFRGDEKAVTDSLSPDCYRTTSGFMPGITLKKNTKVTRWNISLEWQSLQLFSGFNNSRSATSVYRYWLPSAWLQKDMGSGQRLTVRYTTMVSAPGLLQLLPVTDNRNPLLRYRGNPWLKPEYVQELNLDYHYFDQFSMTTFFVMLNGRYTNNRMDWSRIVQPDLSQDLQMINTPYGLQANFNAQYGRPIRKLGINLSVSLQELWNRGLSPVNNVDNTNDSWSHRLRLELSNQNNDVWDIRCGGSLLLSTAHYSINRELNAKYTTYNVFGQIGFSPSPYWRFSFAADLNYYTSQSFAGATTIPMLKAEISRYFFANQRGTITLSGFDLLDRNKDIQRISQMNYLMEQRSNIIGRYAMLSFAYKLHKTGSKRNVVGF